MGFLQQENKNRLRDIFSQMRITPALPPSRCVDEIDMPANQYSNRVAIAISAPGPQQLHVVWFVHQTGNVRQLGKRTKNPILRPIYFPGAISSTLTFGVVGVAGSSATFFAITCLRYGRV